MPSIIPSPAVTSATGASLDTFVPLAPGDVIDALVLSVIKDTTFRLQLPAGTIDIQTDSPLVPGTRVQLAVDGTASQPRITLTPLPDGAAPVRAGFATSTKTDVQAPAAPSQADRAGAVVAAIVRDAATRQGGAAQLYADLEASFAQPSLSIPAPVDAATRQLFALRLDATDPSGIDGDDIKVALARSGLVSALNPSLDGSRPLVPLDARALLLSLRTALKNWEIAERVTPSPNSAPLVEGSALPAASQRQPGPMLPYPDGPTVPQPAADPSIPVNATARELALHLLDKTDATIAREILLKIASLPDRPDPNTKPGEAHASRMTFDIPLATAMGTAVAQIRIERDAARRDSETAAPVWRANFSVDVDPIGPVHVRIALTGGKVAVSFNAERAESAASLSAGLPFLAAGLRNVAVEPGALTCQAGQPASASADPGLYVDQAS